MKTLADGHWCITGDPVEQIIKHNGGMVDRAVDAVGYQAVDKEGSKEQPNVVLDQLIMVTRPTGGRE